MKQKEEILNTLSNFMGGDELYKFSPLSNLLASEGVIYLAEAADCFWLLNILLSVQYMKEIKNQDMQVLKFDLASKLVRIEDGNNNVLYSQQIKHTDFPLDSVEIWVQNGVVYLPSEH